MSTTATITTVPKPEQVRKDLQRLSLQLRLTRSLLKLAERVHRNTPTASTAPTQEAARVAC